MHIMHEIELRPRVMPELPRQLYIEVTNHCNSLCVSCPLTYDHFLPFEPKHHLSWEDFRRIVDQVPVIERAILHGIGEPLLNRELPRFVAHLKDRGAHVLFNSNGVLLDERRGEALVDGGAGRAARLARRGDTGAVRPPARHRPTAAHRAQPAGVVARHGGRKSPRVSLWLVGMQENLHQLLDFVRLGAAIGVPEVYLQRLVYFGSGARIADDTTMVAEQSLYAALEDQQARSIREAEQLAAELGMPFVPRAPPPPTRASPSRATSPWRGCMRPWSLMYITANGTALPCCISPFAAEDFTRIVLGNVLEEPLAAVWNGERYQALRAAVDGDAPAPWPCQFCGVKWSL